MIHIVGGTYIEECIDPEWNQFHGSGVRAAAALMDLCNTRALTTYISGGKKQLLDALGNAFKFTVHPVDSRVNYRFSYAHPLSTPQIFPPLGIIDKAENIEVTDENILRFGFIEGDAIVHGTNVVYDPQSAYNPQPFGKNGSTAKRLAIVANAREASMMTGERHPRLAGQRLLESENAEVMIIKCGSSGALVMTAAEVTQVPIFRTESVWPIGSGDIFSAVFAHFWAGESCAPAEAAQLASRAAAYYCSNPYLPIPPDFGDSINSDQELSSKITEESAAPKPQVYLAGPFFSMMQRWMVHESRQALLEQGLRVFSPFHDVGIGAADDIAVADLKGLDESQAVFAIVDGLDAGTLFEIGYARARDIPVVVFVQSEGVEALKMLDGTGCQIVQDFTTAIYKVKWACM